MIVYRIRNWDENFETGESRKRKMALTWIRVTTKHDGKSYRRLMRHEHAAAIYGAWILICAVAGKCPVRGVLADEDGPLTIDDLEDKTGLPAEQFQQAIEVLESERFKWLETIEYHPNLPEHQQASGEHARSAPTTLHHTTPQDTTVHNPTGQPGGVLKKFKIWKNATREEITCPSGAQRVFQLATGAGLCTPDERLHVFRLICSLNEASGNLPGLLTAILRGDAGQEPWRARGTDHDEQAREWIRSLDTPPEDRVRTSDLTTPPGDQRSRAEQLRALTAMTGAVS